MDEAALYRELAAGFADEAADLCGRATAHVLALDGGGADARGALDGLARALHTLKGSSAICGLAAAADLAHALEDALAGVKAGVRSFTRADADLMLAGLGEIREVALASRARSLDAPGSGAPPRPAAAVPAPAAAEEPADGLEAPRDWKITPQAVESLLRQVDGLRDPGLDAQARSRALTALERDIASIGTLPLSMLEQPLQLMARDQARALGKRVRLAMVGGELRLERGLLAALKPPLVHLVRNAIDHGLEPPADRDAAGKHPEGSVEIRAQLEGNLLFVEVGDDGAGIDPALVRRRAVERGLATQAEAAALDTAASLRLLFAPGFSTREGVTRWSGRGVGLDVVRRAARALDGEAWVTSRQGQGSRFMLSLPLKQGALPALLVEARGVPMALPMSGVAECLAFRASAADAPDQVDIRERRLPLADLGHLLGLAPAADPRPGRPMLRVRGARGEAALLCCRVMGGGEAPVWPLPPGLPPLPCYRGVLALDDGRLAPLLNPDWLAARAAGEEAP